MAFRLIQTLGVDAVSQPQNAFQSDSLFLAPSVLKNLGEYLQNQPHLHNG